MPSFSEQIEPLVLEMRKIALKDLEDKTAPVVGQRWPALVEEIEALEKSLAQTNAWRASDLQGAIFLRVSCMVLAAYRGLQPLYGNNDALLDLLRQWMVDVNFRDGMDAFLLSSFGISREDPEKAWDNLRQDYIERIRSRYGQSWEYEQGIHDDQRFFINIRKCGFADFFLANDARDLLYQFCATDYAWGDALEEYHIRFERPTTLSEGSDMCRFQFFKMKDYPKS